MTGKRRKTPENTKIPQKNTSKGSYFMVYNVTLLSWLLLNDNKIILNALFK